MSNEKQKDDKAPAPKKVEGADSTELDGETLDGVSGGMMPVMPGTKGHIPLPGNETDVCISQ